MLIIWRLFVRHAGTGVEYACRRLRKRGMAVSGAVTLAKYFARLGQDERPCPMHVVDCTMDSRDLNINKVYTES